MKTIDILNKMTSVFMILVMSLSAFSCSNALGSKTNIIHDDNDSIDPIERAFNAFDYDISEEELVYFNDINDSVVFLSDIYRGFIEPYLFVQQDIDSAPAGISFEEFCEAIQILVDLKGSTSYEEAGLDHIFGEVDLVSASSSLRPYQASLLFAVLLSFSDDPDFLSELEGKDNLSRTFLRASFGSTLFSAVLLFVGAVSTVAIVSVGGTVGIPVLAAAGIGAGAFAVGMMIGAAQHDLDNYIQTAVSETVATGYVVYNPHETVPFAYVEVEDQQWVLMPRLSPLPGVFTSEQLVVITTSTAGASLRYTLDGTTPTAENGHLYTGPVILSSSATIKAIALKEGIYDSQVRSGSYAINLEQVAQPYLNPAPGTYTGSREVSISVETPGAVIRYTTDGSIPTADTGKVYTGPVTVSTTTTIQIIAFKQGMAPSQVRSGTYTINLERVSMPVLSPNPGTYYDTQLVSIETATLGATILYTTDFSEPSVHNSSSIEYTGPISVSSTTRIEVIAYKEGMEDSWSNVGTYTMKVATPSIYPEGSSSWYDSPVTITMTSETPGAAFRYTTDGSFPSLVNGFDYNGPVTLTASATVRAMAYKDGMVDSDMKSRMFTIEPSLEFYEVSAPQSNWRSVAYGNGMFVAVAWLQIGMTGTRVMTSPDGITWTARTAAEENGWTAVTYGDGMFVAVASSGTNRVMTSPDGITWTARTAAAESGWSAVTYGNGVFVAVASWGTVRVMTSSNGINWTAPAPETIHGGDSVAYGNGLFVAVSYLSTDSFITSSDGMVWTERPVNAGGHWELVSYANDMFFAVAHEGEANLMTSPDGITWTNASHSNFPLASVTSINYGDGLFVASSDNGVFYSFDGNEWVAAYTTISSSSSIVYGDGRFVAVGSSSSTAMYAEWAYASTLVFFDSLTKINDGMAGFTATIILPVYSHQPGANGNIRWIIDWGDGTVQESAWMLVGSSNTTYAHHYSNGGTYEVEVWLYWDQIGRMVESESIMVSPP